MTCNCTQLANLLRWYYLPTMYSLEFCLGLLGNLLVILGYLFCLKGWKSSNVYLFNLAVSDLLFLCTLPRLANCYARDRPEVSPGFCIANRLLLHVNLYSSILFMAWVSADRYLLVAPLLVFIVRDMERSNWTRCSDFGSLSAGGDGGRHLAYSLALTATGYLLPLLALCLSSARIAAVLKAQAGLFQNRADGFQRPQRMVLATAAMFLVLYAPYHVMRNVHIAHQAAAAAASDHTCDRCVESAYIVTRPIAFAHSVVNPAFYFFMGDHFREQLIDRVKALFRGRGSQQKQSQGRESTTPVV
ncbi:hypothetical protein ANANG_G00129640 [Anguilla anguilla]|uniref:G-protein coupled receptors family 1 profile domain-containing protein n=1 Tax=Anguilla anguilla TaxID=7936 RepID=A0A9D3MGU2_ANGAN|nr:hypothetical protein ANANG_G00129640 [Anguilla anguilla]